MLEAVRSRITISNIIAELTHLLDRGIILKKLAIKTEQFTVQNEEPEIKVAYTSGQKEESDKGIRFKVVLSGLAIDAAEVAKMVNKLEQSDYFFQVVPGYSKNTTTEQYYASEFEVTCYLSNYRLES